MPRTTIADRLMAEVILYGGLPMTRANVYKQALEDTGSGKAADMFAFASHRKAVTGVKPLTLTEFRKITGDVRKKQRKGGK